LSPVRSAERYEAREQIDYNFTPRMFAFGGLRYEHDLFDGFQYQASAAGGLLATHPTGAAGGG